MENNENNYIIKEQEIYKYENIEEKEIKTVFNCLVNRGLF